MFFFCFAVDRKADFFVSCELSPGRYYERMPSGYVGKIQATVEQWHSFSSLFSSYFSHIIIKMKLLFFIFVCHAEMVNMKRNCFLIVIVSLWKRMRHSQALHNFFPQKKKTSFFPGKYSRERWSIGKAPLFTNTVMRKNHCLFNNLI